MKQHTISTLFVITLLLAACQPATPLPPTAVPTPVPPTTAPPSPTATSAPSYIPYVSDETYAYYDFNDSFENVSDPTAYGISSWMNTVQVNTTNYNRGQQSLQADGTVGDDQHYALSFDFSIQTVLGVDSYDFSNKVIVLSVFIPEDSPITVIWFEADKSDKFVQISNAKIADKSIDYGWTPNLQKGKWIEAVIDLKETASTQNWGWTWGPNGNLTKEEAWEVVTQCETFKILGMKGENTTSALPTYFLLDDLRWLDRNNINIDPNADSLRKYATNNHLYIGSYGEYTDLLSVYDAKFSQILAQEYNLLIPGSTTHWFLFEPTEGTIDFSQTDAMVDFALGNNMAVYSYMDLVHTQMPDWLKDKSFAELGPVVTNFIDTVGTHYRGKIAIWNVFSEVLNGNGDGFNNRSPVHQFGDNMYSPWVEGSDTSLIKEAFQQARIADPNAILVLNDYETEEMGRQKAEFFYAFVKELVDEDIPIDGVAFEMHAPYPPLYPNTPYEYPRILDLPAYLSAVDANVKRYNELGLKVVFSEIDVPIFTKNIDQTEVNRRIDYQAQIYGGLMKIALENPNVIAYSTWGFSDRNSWVNSETYGWLGYSIPDMFDEFYQPKPAYDEVLSALKNGR
jgi:endo-1,4-beta-xylanase